MEKQIIEVLKELNIPMANLGFSYLSDSIKAILKEEKSLTGITKTGGLYDFVARKHKSTMSRVERAIRHAIETAILVTDADTLTKYIGSSSSNTTNRNFIAALSYAVKELIEQEQS